MKAHSGVHSPADMTRCYKNPARSRIDYVLDASGLISGDSSCLCVSSDPVLQCAGSMCGFIGLSSVDVSGCVPVNAGVQEAVLMKMHI